MNKEKGKKIYLFCGIAVICISLLSYLAFSLFFANHYYFGTVIGDFECGGKTSAEVEALIAQRASNYTLRVQGREDMEDTLTGSEINLQFQLDDTLKKIIDLQNGFEWISFLWNDMTYDMPVTINYEEALLDEKIQSMSQFQDGTMRKPADAYIGEYSSESGSYPIVEEDQGTLVDKQAAKQAIAGAVENLAEVLVLDETDCYVKPEVCKDDEALNRLCKKLNKFVSSRIVYDWHGIEEIVDGEIIQEWLTFDRENGMVTVDEEAVREYVDELSKKNDTFGKTRKFRTSQGREIELKPGSYGWRVDRAAEAEKLEDLIRMGWTGDREPEYLYTAAVKGEDDIGDSYVEIDLTAQHLYLYVEGELVTETDFVSGNVARGYTTPDGVYGLTYKTLDATLKGPGYATPVKYWMPFNGNIGMHDAKWRKQFGGSIYLRNGSHGCINLPVEEAEKIYEEVYKGFPVICYTDEFAEKEKPKKSGNKTTQTGGENPGETPVVPGVTVPGENPGETPVVPGVTPPGENPGETPVVPGVTVPGENPGETPVVPGVTVPGENPGETPVVPGVTVPGENPGETPVVPGVTVPGENPGETPVMPSAEVTG